MKNIKLIPGFLCLVFALAACSGQNKKVTTGEDGLKYSSDQILDPSLFKTDYELDVNVNPTDPEYKVVSNQKTFDVNEIQNSFGNSIIQVKSEQGYIGFYSTLHNDYIIAPRLEPNTFVTSFYSQDNNYNTLKNGGLLQLKYEDQYFVYDALGNLLLKSDNPLYYSSASRIDGSTVIRNKLSYVSFNTADGQFIFEYDKNGKAKEVNLIPEEIQIDENEKEYEGPKLNDVFTFGAVDLKEYGLEGYRMMNNNNGYISIYNNDGFVSSFYIGGNPGDFNLVGVVGTNIYYQLSRELNDRAEKYSYEVGGTKYYLESYSVDVKTGEKKALKVNAVFDTIIPLKDENKNVNMYLARYESISSAKVLMPAQQRIVDKDFVFHDDVSGVGFGTMQRISDNRYIDGTGVLYDENMKPITYLSNLRNRTIHRNQKVISGTVDGKWGLVDFDGKVVIEFRYDEIKANLGKDGKFIAKKDGKVYRLTAGSSNATLIGSGMVQLATNLWRVVNPAEDKYVYFTTSKDLLSLDLELNITQNYGVIMGENANALYLSYPINEKSEMNGEHTIQMVCYSLVPDSYTPQTIDAATKGQAISTDLITGASTDDALPLQMGLNKVHFQNNTNYAKFDATEDGYYGVFYDDADVYAYNLYSKDNTVLGSSYTSIPLNTYSYFAQYQDVFFERFALINAKAGYSYVFVYQNNAGKQAANLLIDRADGLVSASAIDGGVAGLGAPVKLGTSKYISGVDQLWVSFTSLNDTKSSVAISGQSGASVVAIYKNGSFSDNLYDQFDRTVDFDDGQNTCLVQLNNGINAGASLSLTLSEYSDVGHIKGLLISNPYAGQGIETDLNQQYPISEHYGFYRFTIPTGGRYQFNMSFSGSRYVDLLEFDANNKLLNDNYGGSRTTWSPTTGFIGDGGYVVVKFSLDNLSATTFALNVSGAAGYSASNPSNLNENGQRITLSADEYRYYSFTPAAAGKFSIVSNDDENLETSYRLATATSGNFNAFNHSFSYNAGATAYIVKVHAKRALTFFMAQNVVSAANVTNFQTGSFGAPIYYEYIEGNGFRNILFNGGSTGRDVKINFSAGNNLSLFFSTNGFLETQATTTYNYSTLIHLGANESLYVTIKNLSSSSINNVNLSVVDLANAYNVSAYMPEDSTAQFDWLSSNGMYTAPKTMPYGKSAEMYVVSSINTGKITFKLDLGYHGTFRVYRQAYNVADGTYGARSQVTSYTSEQHNRLVTLTPTSVNMRFVLVYVENDGTINNPVLTARVSNFAYTYVA